MAIGWAAFAMLGSWYPFGYRSGTLEEAWLIWRASGGLGLQGRSDLAINLLLGIPTGFFGTLALMNPPLEARDTDGRGQRWNDSVWFGLMAMVLVVSFVAGWAVLVELGQHWFGHRVPSRADTTAQTLGGVLGVAVAWFGGGWFCQRAASLFGRQSRQTPLDALLDLYAAGYACWMLMPFVPVSPSQLAQKWRSGSIQLSPFSTWSSNPWQAAYTLAVTVATALPIGFAIASRLRRMSGQIHLATAAVTAAFAVVLLEICQIFIETRTAALDDAIWSAVGAASGALALGLLSQTGLRSQRASWGTMPVLAMSTILYAMVYTLVAWAPFDFVETSAELHQKLQQFSFQSYRSWLAGDDMGHASNLLRSLFWSAPLGGLAGMTAGASKTKRGLFLPIALFFCGAVCLAAEGGQVMSRQHDPTVIGFATRWFGCVIGILLARLIARPRQQ